MIRVASLLLVLTLLFCSAAQAEAPAPGKQVGQSMELKDDAGTRTFRYLLYLPTGYEMEESKFPLILFLHGSGERGDDLELVKKHGPPKIVESKPELGFIVVSPQCPTAMRWQNEDLTKLLDHVTKTLRVDEDRVYLTGLSMGGGGAWNLAAAQPDRFAAIAPICGRADPAKAEKIKHLPTWVFHGAKDTAVPVAQSEKMVEALKAAGGEPKLTIYPDAGHDSWTQTYDDPEFYAWLVKQRRRGQGPGGRE